MGGAIDALVSLRWPRPTSWGDQAKLIGVEGQKIALFRGGGGFKCTGSWRALMRPSQLNALIAACCPD